MNKGHYHILLPKKKIVLQIYFIVFIILNLFDFLGLLGGDIDFFKKILSWIIIGYIFYKASFTELFLGTRDKLMDFILILSFSMMSIVKSLMHYVNLNETKQFTFHIFNFIITPLQNIGSGHERVQFEQILFTIGLILIVLITIALLKTYKPTKDSLIGSFNLKGYFKFIGGEYLILIATLIFFSTIVFNFFMEWFALAVDSIILLIGLIYYLVLYLHNHTKIDSNKYLSQVSNTGNSFYQNLIENFANRKTFMIGISIILTLHLIVDIGVYIIPYIFGTSNSLYESSIGTPIFNFFDPLNSQVIKDFQIFDNVLLNLVLFMGHFYTLIFFTLVMLGPFYYFYKFVQKNKSHSKNSIKHLFLVGAIVYLSIIIIPELNPPISLSVPTLDSGIVGVKLDTSTILEGYTQKVTISLIALLSIIILANIEMYHILFKSNNYFLKYKLMPIIALIFFVIYISIFFYSTFNFQSQNMQKAFISPKLDDTSQKYYDILNKIESKDVNKFGAIPLEYKKSNYSLTINLLREDINKTNYNAYALISVNNRNKNNKFEIDHIENAYFANTMDYANFKFNNYQTSFIYFIGKDNPIITQREVSVKDIQKYIGPPISIKENSAGILIESLRVIFIVIFYVFGTIAFVRYFLREKILD